MPSPSNAERLQSLRYKAVILIATRPESKRLPGKVFKKIAGKPALSYLLDRLKISGIPIVLCVPYECRKFYLPYIQEGITIFEGHAESPLHRMAHYVKWRNPNVKWIIRITHDDILIDVETMLDMLIAVDKNNDIGYAVSPKIVEGAGVEIIRRENLIEAADSRQEPTEFVSYFVKDKNLSKNLIFSPRESIQRPYRLTMDYYEDYLLLEVIFQELGTNATLDHIVEFIDKNPYLLKINSLPKLSIYTCAYNASPYIKKTINSILSSSFSDFEYIFVEDGSQDCTLFNAVSFCYDKRMRIFVNEENRGLSSSSNIALDRCRSQYVMRIDADDLIKPDSIKIMMEQIQSTHSGIVYPGYKKINESDETISDFISAKKNHHIGCAIIDKRLLNEIRFKEGLRHFDSLDIYNRIKNKSFISYIEEPLWFYRQRNGSLSSKMTPERVEAYKEISK